MIPQVLVRLLAQIGLAAATLATAWPALASTPLKHEQSTILDLENRPITFHLHRFDGDGEYPILLVIDGSGCEGQLREGLVDLFRPQDSAPVNYARLAVDKPGVAPDAPQGTDCTDEYRQRYSLDRRTLDHLRVLQYLKTEAAWWDGELYIYGWSDGGRVGARLLSYYPNVSRAVLGAIGGGYTMEEHFKLFWDCARDRTNDHVECIDEIDLWLADLRGRPIASLGKQDSNQLWRSRMFTDLATLLSYGDTPLLIVHGALDRDAAPVESARKLIFRLQEASRPLLTYCEVADMAHNTDTLPMAKGWALERAMLTYLFAPSNWIVAQEGLCDIAPSINDHTPPGRVRSHSQNQTLGNRL